MTSVAFIVGTLIIGFCLIGAAFIISGAVTGAAAASKESAPQPLQQPTLSFLTEFDAADYIGISLEELEYMRGEGMLDDTFIAVTSLEQTGEEDYYTTVDGVETRKTRPIMAPVTRFLFNRELLDVRLLELIKEGQHVNPARGRSNYKQNKQKSAQNGQGQRPEKNGQKNGEQRQGQDQKRRNDDPNRSKKNNPNGGNNGQKSSNNGNNNGNGQKKPRDNAPKPVKPADSDDGFGKSAKADRFDDDGFGKPAKSVDFDDDGFGKPSKKPVDDDGFGKSPKSIDFEDDGFGVPSTPSIVYDEDDDDVDIDSFAKN